MLRHMKLLGLDQRGHGREVSYSILASSPNPSLTAIGASDPSLHGSSSEASGDSIRASMTSSISDYTSKSMTTIGATGSSA